MLEKIMGSYQKVAIGVAGIGLTVGLMGCGTGTYQGNSTSSSMSTTHNPKY